MFLSLLFIRLLIIFCYLWGDYIKILIFLEILRLVFMIVVLWGVKFDYFSINFFFSCLIFLVCESSMGFLLFIYYIRIENEVVKKIMLVQF
jgi:hypothetical protein